MRFFVVCDDDDIGGRIRAILLDRGFECPVAQQVGLAGAVSVAQLVRQPAARDEMKSLGAPVGSPESDRLDSTVVVVLLSEALERGLEAIRQIRALTTQRILAVGPLLDTKLVLRAIREGANEYLDLSELDSEVTHALDRIEEQTGRGRFIGVWSATGGVGCSTLVVNLACALGQKPNTCALVDLKIEGGDLASLLDVKPNYSLVDISRNTDGMDYTVIRNRTGFPPIGNDRNSRTTPPFACTFLPPHCEQHNA
ncbi:MAG: P-loop NTPase [Planctomycetota bacterium]|nr:P-loop NTPase [Planctomycetota bacterium]